MLHSCIRWTFEKGVVFVKACLSVTAATVPFSVTDVHILKVIRHSPGEPDITRDVSHDFL